MYNPTEEISLKVQNMYSIPLYKFLWPEDGPQCLKHVVTIINRMQDSCVFTYTTPSLIAEHNSPCYSALLNIGTHIFIPCSSSELHPRAVSMNNKQVSCKTFSPPSSIQLFHSWSSLNSLTTFVSAHLLHYSNFIGCHLCNTYLLTPWCRVLLEKLTGLQLVKKFSPFHGTRKFITALTSVRHLSLSWASPIQSIYPHPTSWRSILLLSTHLRLGLPSGLLPSGFPTKTL